MNVAVLCLRQSLDNQLCAQLFCRRPLNRRIVIVEGIYASNGDLSPLDKVYELKEKYK